MVRAIPNYLTEYSIVTGLPVTAYKGVVSFNRLGTGKTRVTWHCEFTPTLSLLAYGFYPLFSHIFKTYLTNLKAFTEARLKPRVPRM